MYPTDVFVVWAVGMAGDNDVVPAFFRQFRKTLVGRMAEEKFFMVLGTAVEKSDTPAR